MERRSNSKSIAKQQYHESAHKSGTKRGRHSEGNDRLSKYNEVQKRVKENLMFSLIEVFQESRNEPSLIVPWMKQFHQLEERILGTNYVICGPSQSGKYSAVKFALGKFYPDVQEILINCDVSTTEHQFICKLLNEFASKSPKCKWPTEQRDINKLIPNDCIDFERLTPFIVKGNLKFVIVVKNGEHLVGFKKQSMLYNLFEWMRSQTIQQRGGLVILTRNLMLIDRFEKRVKSRFQGNRLTIFRPTEPLIYIKIIVKRIEAVIRDKQTWLKLQKIQNTSMEDENEVYNSDEDTNTRRRAKPKKANKGKSDSKVQVNVDEFMKLRDKYKYVKQVCDYSDILTQYLDGGFKELGIADFFTDKIVEFYNSKSKEDMVLYSDKSSLTVHQQIQCLYKIKKAIEKSTEIIHFFRSKILEYQIITIPFVLRIFQHIFLTIEESIVKELPVDKLQGLILQLLKRNVQFQFPVNVIESNSLQSTIFLIKGLNNIELMLIIAIYNLIQRNEHPIKLTIIHNEFRSKIHTQIHQTTKHESSKLPTRIIEQSIDRLYRCGIILYQPFNIWNSEISLLMELKKIRKGLEHLAEKKKGDLSENLKRQLRSLGISRSSGQTEHIHINTTNHN